jgi:hypothetical protein
MLSENFKNEIRLCSNGSAMQKAKHYSVHVEGLLAEISALETKLENLNLDTEALDKLRNLTGVDPKHLARLIDLEKAIGSVGYGLPAMG